MPYVDEAVAHFRHDISLLEMEVKKLDDQKAKMQIEMRGLDERKDEMKKELKNLDNKKEQLKKRVQEKQELRDKLQKLSEGMYQFIVFFNLNFGFF